MRPSPKRAHRYGYYDEWRPASEHDEDGTTPAMRDPAPSRPFASTERPVPEPDADEVGVALEASVSGTATARL
jgi:hypothetical protein